MLFIVQVHIDRNMTKVKAWFSFVTRTWGFFAVQFTQGRVISNYIADINNDTNGGNPDPNADISQGKKNLMQWEHDGDSENKSINEWNHEKNVEW